MKKRRIAVLLAAGMLLTGCIGTNHLKEGVSYLEEKKYEEARASFQEEIEKEKNLGEAYRGIGIACFELKEYDKAIDSFEAAIENGAEKTGTLYNFLGISNMRAENYDEAVKAFETGLSAEDSSDTMKQEMLFNTVVSYEEMGDWERAKEKLNEYIELYPDDAKAQKEAEFLETR